MLSAGTDVVDLQLLVHLDARKTLADGLRSSHGMSGEEVDIEEAPR
jgi:hypothetical protein